MQLHVTRTVCVAIGRNVDDVSVRTIEPLGEARLLKCPTDLIDLLVRLDSCTLSNPGIGKTRSRLDQRQYSFTVRHDLVYRDGQPQLFNTYRSAGTHQISVPVFHSDMDSMVHHSIDSEPSRHSRPANSLQWAIQQVFGCHPCSS